MQLYPLLLYFSRIHGILCIMADNLQILYMKMHDIFQRAFVSIMKCAIKTQKISMLQLTQNLIIVVYELGINGQQDIWLVILSRSRLHLHEQTQCVLVILMWVLPIVEQTQQMPFPVHKLFPSVLLKTHIRVTPRALLHVLRPCGIHQFIAIKVGDSNGKYNRYEKEQSAGDYHLFCEDKTSREQTQAVYFVSEIYQKFSVIAQFSLAQRATMFS